MNKPNLSGFLKNKVRSASAKAALTSFLVHLVLILTAGSIVAVRYVQKQNAQLIAVADSRPKLERRKLQSPQRVEQLQKRDIASKLVSKKVSFANPDFVLPDTGNIASLKTQKFALPGTDAGRILRNLNRNPSIGPSRIDFFGLRAEGEKALLLVDVSEAMLTEQTGGTATFDYIRQELVRSVSGMKPAMLFNVILFDGTIVRMFRPEMIPAVPDAVTELTEWLKPVNSDPDAPGLDPEQNNYLFPQVYETAVGADAQGWALAVQAAMEQRPDVILTLGSGWGQHPISEEKAARLLDYAMLELLVGNQISRAPALEPDRKIREALVRQAVIRLQKEDKSRTAEKTPPRFVRDIAGYIEYSKDQLLDHLDAVAQRAYTDETLALPSLFFVCLTGADSQVVAGDVIGPLRTLTAHFSGKLDFLRRETVRMRMAEQAAQLAAVAPEEKLAVSGVNLFGTEERGSRIAYLMDVSESMMSETNGGTGSCSILKDQIRRSIAAIEPGVLFNLFVYDGTNAAVFRPEMVAVSADVLTDLERWLQPLNADPARPGFHEGVTNRIVPRLYDTVLGGDIAGWPLAMQAAIEQRADVIFLVASEWGNLPLNPEKGRKLLDFSVWDTWGGGASGGGGGGGGGSTATITTESEETVESVDEEGNVTSDTVVTTESTTVSTGGGGGGSSGGSAALGNITGLQEDKKQRNEFFREALKAIEKEDKVRKEKKLPQPFIRDVLSYLRYSPAQISAHLDTVWTENAADPEARKPAVHFLCVVPREGKPDADLARNIKRLTTEYGGSMILMRGAPTVEEAKKLNRDLIFAE